MLTSLDDEYSLKIPAGILQPVNGQLQSVTIKPLTIHEFQMIMKAAKNDHMLIPLLIVKEAVVAPRFDLQQIRGMKVGLVNFLIGEIKKLSGIL